MKPGVRENVPWAGFGSMPPPLARRWLACSGVFLLPPVVAAFYLATEHRGFGAADLRWRPTLPLAARALANLRDRHAPRSSQWHDAGGDDSSSSR